MMFYKFKEKSNDFQRFNTIYNNDCFCFLYLKGTMSPIQQEEEVVFVIIEFYWFNLNAGIGFTL